MHRQIINWMFLKRSLFSWISGIFSWFVGWLVRWCVCSLGRWGFARRRIEKREKHQPHFHAETQISDGRKMVSPSARWSHSWIRTLKEYSKRLPQELGQATWVRRWRLCANRCWNQRPRFAEACTILRWRNSRNGDTPWECEVDTKKQNLFQRDDAGRAVRRNLRRLRTQDQGRKDIHLRQGRIHDCTHYVTRTVKGVCHRHD